MQMDKETMETQREGQMIEDFTKSEGWQWIRDRITEEIMDLQSIRNLEGKTGDELLADIKARNSAVEILLGLIKKVEGRASQHSNNKTITHVQEEIIIYGN